MTIWEEQVINLAIEWRNAKYAVEEAVIRQNFWHAVDMVKKERRDAATQSEKEEFKEGATQTGK